MDARQTLETAAHDMREKHGPDHERHKFWHSLADAMDAYASGLPPNYEPNGRVGLLIYEAARGYVEAAGIRVPL